MTRTAPIAGRSRAMPTFSGRLLGIFLAGWLAWFPVSSPLAEPASEPTDDGVFLPTNRELERSLDTAQRFLREGRWSDAAALLDEVLAAPRDAFGSGADRRATSLSLKAEAWTLLRDQPRAARAAYELLFSARAKRRLDEAIAADSLTAIVEVARRWFMTPAGREAAIITALTALEAGQPAVAAAWLDRLAEANAPDLPGEPTLSLMRSVARARSGDLQVAREILSQARGKDRVAGTDVVLSMSEERAVDWLSSTSVASEAWIEAWPQPRGDAARNATVVASRPLLVPRYRVPLARHPEEVRLLNQRRQTAAAAERFLMPVAEPIAVDGLILVRTPLGILAIDFATGKRLWLRPLLGPPGSDPLPDDQRDAGSGGPGEDAGEWAFENHTCAALTVAEGFVFAVETPPHAAAEKEPLGDFNGGRRQAAAFGSGSNRLRAFDIAARGAPRWHMPAAGGEAWYLGAPLAVGGALYVLVEEKGEIRLDVLDAKQGSVVWSQPLAELDENEQIGGMRSRSRRLAGLAPALADGVIVCPLGIGAVVGIDLATRTLLWVHRYARHDRPGSDHRPALNDAAAAVRRPPVPGDPVPVIAAGKVLVTPHDAAGLICLDLRSGRPAWDAAVPGVIQVAGVVDGRAIVIGQRAVEGRSLADGSLLWRLPYADAGGRPSGRGILTPERLLLPLDSPEVVEIDLRTGALLARSPARGGLVPGNLVAYRGEVVSRSADSLDVFHQQAALEEQIRTAEAREPRSPWVLHWRGQLELEAGRVAEGLSLLGQVAATAGHRLSPETFPDAIVFGMQRDFAAAAPAWRQAFRHAAIAPGASLAARAAVRVAVDGFIKTEAWDDAWAAVRDLLVAEPTAESAPSRDPADPALAVRDDRWLAGRLETLVERAPQRLRDEISMSATESVTAAAAVPDAGARLAWLESLAERLAPLPAAARAHELAVAAIESTGTPEGSMALRLEWHLMHLARRGTAEKSRAAGVEIVNRRPEPLRGLDASAAAADRLWPLGRIEYRRLPIGRDTFAAEQRGRLMPLAVEVDRESAVPGLRLACDVQEGRLHVFDGFGRPLMDPLTVDPAAARLGLPWLPQASGFEAWTLGRLLCVRTGRTLAAYELAGDGRAAWMHSAPAAAREQAAGLWVRGDATGRPGRLGGMPLGLEITEPEDRSRSGHARGGRPRITGVPHFETGTLVLVDPCSGSVLWERHGLPASAELVGDDDFITVCTASGKDSCVVSMRDGRLVGRCNLPPKRQRLTSCGRRIAVVRPLGDSADRRIADEVRIEVIDTRSNEATALGTVPGESRAAVVDENTLVVLAPTGDLVVHDLAGGSTAFQVRLPSMPAEFERLHVVPWHDRLLVVAGRESPPDAGEWMPELGDLAPLQHLLASGEISRPLFGAMWAVDRDSGDLLWPAPATLDGHSLHLSQPRDLPIVLVSHHGRGRRDGEPIRLRLVGIDKRTGHALFDEQAQPIEPHVFFGCELVGDPARHAITVRSSGETPRWAEVAFTGRPVPPRPPFQAGSATELERLLERFHEPWRSRR